MKIKPLTCVLQMKFVSEMSQKDVYKKKTRTRKHK